jgi:hypothetical protein
VAPSAADHSQAAHVAAADARRVNQAEPIGLPPDQIGRPSPDPTARPVHRLPAPGLPMAAALLATLPHPSSPHFFRMDDATLTRPAGTVTQWLV